ncbi:DUF5753 domain-containing protein [Actinomadura rupiterrae]|uniref:DUF5753 domain-containing protein n=1 Tax=Actinomadura rupiterrae TaxID=559627 RepID=UPI0020A3ABEE|nr:DUF5753 domain-containing protein [Actinomadura rupiterrae]MCP2337709.1 transcriptional regulator with XRE-family HTH domain [Actinomadura rupiterrae]
MTDRPTIRMRKLAGELRRLRERSTLTLEEAVAALRARKDGGQWSPAKLSRIETCARRVRAPDLEELLELYEVPEDRRAALRSLGASARQRGWWDAYADTLKGEALAAIELEAEARTLRSFDGLVLNGLLQTDDYAREVIRVGLMQFASRAEMDRRVDVRRERRRVLTDRRPEPLRLWTIVDEAALRRVVGGPELMWEQYEHLLSVAELPNVMIQVLPFAGGAHPGLSGEFSILDFADSAVPDVAYYDNLSGVAYVEDEDEVFRYSLAFNQLATAALGLDESLRLIATLAQGPQ